MNGPLAGPSESCTPSSAQSSTAVARPAPHRPGPRCRVFAVAAGISAEALRERLSGLSAAWPAGCSVTGSGVPEFVTRSLADVASGFAFPVSAQADAEVVLIVAISVAAAASARRAIERSMSLAPVRHVRPTLVLIEHAAPTPPAPGTAAEPGEACIQLWASAPSEVIAGALAGLAAAGRALVDHAAESALQAQIATTAARQIEEAQQELQLAGQLQRELLPAHLPCSAGLEVAAMYRPGATLSGDFYDAVRLNDHTVGLLLADACGHGVPAALLVMLVSKLLPMTDPRPGLAARIVPPGEALARLNDAFIERRGVLSALISATYAVIDEQAGTVTVSAAGHPPAILVSPGQPTRLVPDGGPLLGVAPGAEYAQATLAFTPGTSLLLYSDGFEHAFGLPGATGQLAAREPTHVEVLASIAAENPPRPLHDAVQAIDDLVLAQRGSLHQIDDITLLAARARVR